MTPGLPLHTPLKLDQNPVWQTPVWSVQTPFDDQFNQALLDEIYSIGKAITTGADTEPHDSLWNYNRPCLDQLKQYIIATVTQVTQASIPEVGALNMSVDSYMCWANIREPGEALEVHAHSDSAVAATYFIQAESNAGDLVLFDTSKCIDWSQGTLSTTPELTTQRITPVPGKLVFFPSYVLHTVEQNCSDQLRITLTCDLKKVIDHSVANSIVLKSWANKMVKIREWNSAS